MRRFILPAFALVFTATLTAGCASTGALQTEPVDCGALGWDACGRAQSCRHGRSFDVSGDEHFMCVARYADVVSAVASPGVALDTASSQWLLSRSVTVTIAEP
jgi:hypothetical protein